MEKDSKNSWGGVKKKEGVQEERLKANEDGRRLSTYLFIGITICIVAGLLFVLFSEVSYEIFQEKLDTKSQKYAEEQTGAIKSKLDVTNVDNDKQTFFITIKNGTRYDLVPDAYTNAGSFNSGEIDIDEDNKIADIMVTVKKKDGTSVFSGMVVHGNNNTNATFTGTILQDDIAISRDNQGLIEITISKADMNTGETYSIIITAASTTSTTEYTAI